VHRRLLEHERKISHESIPKFIGNPLDICDKRIHLINLLNDPFSQRESIKIVL